MVEISWSPRALEDLEEIRRYIARDAPRTARDFVRRIFETVERLEAFPRSGGIVPEIGDETIREIRLRKYRIIYRHCEAQTIEIVTVYHGSRLLDLALFRDGFS